MYELLLQPSSRLDFDSLLGYTVRVRLDIARFRNDLASHACTARIKRDVQVEGIRNAVNATPKFYVDGKRIDSKVPLGSLADAVCTAATTAA